MQNYALLRAGRQAQAPGAAQARLCRDHGEWLLAAEYILRGNTHVMLCERGIRGFDPQTRNVLDLTGVPLLRS